MTVTTVLAVAEWEAKWREVYKAYHNATRDPGKSFVMAHRWMQEHGFGSHPGPGPFVFLAHLIGGLMGYSILKGLGKAGIQALTVLILAAATALSAAFVSPEMFAVFAGLPLGAKVAGIVLPFLSTFVVNLAKQVVIPWLQSLLTPPPKP